MPMLGTWLLLALLGFSTLVLLCVYAIRAILGRDRDEAQRVAADLATVVEEACELQADPYPDGLLAQLLAAHRREDPVRPLRGTKPRALRRVA